MKKSNTRPFLLFILALISWNNIQAQVPVVLKDSVGNPNITDNEAIGNTFYFGTVK